MGDAILNSWYTIWYVIWSCLCKWSTKLSREQCFCNNSSNSHALKARGYLYCSLRYVGKGSRCPYKLLEDQMVLQSDGIFSSDTILNP